jgi:hypothetical protein
MKAQSTIFPCPPEPESIVVSKTQAYWVRYIDSQDMAIVRLQRDPVVGTTAEGGISIEYDEVEVRLPGKDLEGLPLNVDTLWLENVLKGDIYENPIDAVDLMPEKKVAELSQIKLSTRTRIALVKMDVKTLVENESGEPVVNTVAR